MTAVLLTRSLPIEEVMFLQREVEMALTVTLKATADETRAPSVA